LPESFIKRHFASNATFKDRFCNIYNYFWSTAKFSFRLIKKLQIVDIVTHFDKYESLDKIFVSTLEVMEKFVVAF